MAEEHPTVYIKYFRGIRELQRIIIPIKPRNFRTNVYVFVGEPGSGKSAGVAACIGEESFFYKSSGKWWDGYAQQKHVILDDFYGDLPYAELLKVCDRYPHKVEVKGGFEEFVSQCIWITSNKLIDDWYHFEKFKPEAIYRRLTKYKWVSKENKDAPSVYDNVQGVLINY